ncbi:MAG: hypothetical protein AABX11_02875 [Nanoarchaeota archaeon]
MRNITPQKFLALIDREKLDSLDQEVYDGTKRFTKLCKPLLLSAATSDNYQLKLRGKLLSGGSYFSFVGNQGIIIADILNPLPDELLGVAKDSKLMKIIDNAHRSGFRTSIPLSWHNSRQMNAGLYDEAAQFDIKPPCLRVGFNCNPGEFLKRVEELATIENKIYSLYVQRARKS